MRKVLKSLNLKKKVKLRQPKIEIEKGSSKREEEMMKEGIDKGHCNNREKEKNFNRKQSITKIKK